MPGALSLGTRRRRSTDKNTFKQRRIMTRITLLSAAYVVALMAFTVAYAMLSV
jgi:hypothetical protein